VGIRQIVLLVVAVAVAGTAGFLGHALYTGQLGSLFGLASAAPKNADKDRQSFVTALGRIEPETEIIDVGVPTGSRIGSVLVKVGDTVKEGKTELARLDSYEEMEAAWNLAKVQFEEAEKRFNAETKYANAAIEQAGLRKRQAKEVALLAIQAEEAEVSRAKAELKKALRDQQRVKDLFNNQAIPGSQKDNVDLIVEQAEKQLEAHSANLARLQKDREINLELAQADLKAAEASKPRAELATQKDSLEAALKVAKARMERTIIRAPSDGEVLNIMMRAGETARGTPLLALGNTKSMMVVAEVYETEVRKVQVGQKALITSKAFAPETRLFGKVERVGKLVRRNEVMSIDPRANADTRVVEVRIRLDSNEVASHFNNMQVDVFISVDGSGTFPQTPGS
jgi:HlyD family secretion protein